MLGSKAPLCFALLALMMVPGADAWADDGALTGPVAAGDWAQQWLRALLGTAPDQGSDQGPLPFLWQQLHQALGLYSTGMMVIAGLILLWRVMGMIAETAHTGIVMGRRTNQLWVPLRFLLGIGLLVPVAGGLNSGQYAVVKLAEQGSSLASRAFIALVDHLPDAFWDARVPYHYHGARLVALATQMEICRAAYGTAYAALAADPIVAFAGDMTGFVKKTSHPLTGETWLYTNTFFDTRPLCGGYRFYTPGAGASEDEKAVAAASRMLAERVAVQTRLLVDRLRVRQTGSMSLAGDAVGFLDALGQEQTRLLETAQSQIGDQKAFPADQVRRRLAEGGWLLAGGLFWDAATRQWAQSRLLARAVPDVMAPLIGHDVLSRGLWYDEARSHSALHAYQPQQFEKYVQLFDQTNQTMRAARDWLYRQQSGAFAMPDQQDVADALGPYADGAQALAVYDQLIRAGGIGWGVLGAGDGGAGLTGGQASRPLAGPLWANAFVRQPLQSMAEWGRRLMDWGGWLWGMLGPALADPATMGAVILPAVYGAVLILCGAFLCFAIPFLPLAHLFAQALHWFLTLLGAVIAVPLVALAHLHPSGEGVVGPMARRAYWLWLALFARPILIVLGALGAWGAFLMGAWLVTALFGPLFASLTQGDAPVSLGIAGIGFYTALIYVCANRCFRFIGSLPDGFLSWIGDHGLGVDPGMVVVADGAGAAAGSGALGGALSAGGPGGYGPASGGGRGGTGAAAGSDAGYRAGRAGDRALDAALFPQMKEPPLPPVVIAKAEAAAYAKAGDHKAAAEASAGVSSADQAYAARLAQSRQMPGVDTAPKALSLPVDMGGHLLSQMDKGDPQDTEKAPVTPKGASGADKAPSRPQEAHHQAADDDKVPAHPDTAPDPAETEGGR